MPAFCLVRSVGCVGVKGWRLVAVVVWFGFVWVCCGFGLCGVIFSLPPPEGGDSGGGQRVPFCVGRFGLFCRALRFWRGARGTVLACSVFCLVGLFGCIAGLACVVLRFWCEARGTVRRHFFFALSRGTDSFHSLPRKGPLSSAPSRGGGFRGWATLYPIEVGLCGVAFLVWGRGERYWLAVFFV